MPQPNVSTDNIGAVIAENIEHAFVLERVGEGLPVFVQDVDSDDPNNLRVTLDNGQVFIVRIVAGPWPSTISSIRSFAPTCFEPCTPFLPGPPRASRSPWRSSPP